MADRYLTPEEILEADDITEMDVRVPEWIKGQHDTVRIRALSGAKRERYEAAVGYVKGDRWVPKGNAAARLAAMSIIDPKTGAEMFSEEQIGKLGRKSSAALKRVVDASRKLSRLTDEDMDWLEGNSDGVQSEPSSSSSPSLSDARTTSSSMDNSAAPSAVAS